MIAQVNKIESQEIVKLFAHSGWRMLITLVFDDDIVLDRTLLYVTTVLVRDLVLTFGVAYITKPNSTDSGAKKL
uniref:Uncharacterized protein n=1 Tax=Glossina palpalis gambiensis TaxID=67801 RepID=A0A1B0BM40_9MUSC